MPKDSLAGFRGCFLTEMEREETRDDRKGERENVRDSHW